MVTTPVADIPNLLGGLGRMADVGDAAALAGEIGALLDDPGVATAEGDQLRRRTVERFSPGPIAEQLESLYDDVRVATS